MGCLEHLLFQRRLLYPLASTAAAFFVLLNSLFTIHHEYRFSLQRFLAAVSEIIQQNVQEEEQRLLDNDDYEANEGKQRIIPALMKTLTKELIRSYSR